MRLTKPRILPLADEEMDEDQKEAIAGKPKRGKSIGELFKNSTIFNIHRTLIKVPKAYKRFIGWGAYILSDNNSLAARERELVILRTGFNWSSGYEWAQHGRIGKHVGLTDEEICQIKIGPSASGWNEADRALLQAVDELTGDSFITDETWELLSNLTEQQRMDLVFTTGQYTQVCMMLNTFGVQLDEGLTLDPDLKR